MLVVFAGSVAWAVVDSDIELVLDVMNVVFVEERDKVVVEAVLVVVICKQSSHEQFTGAVEQSCKEKKNKPEFRLREQMMIINEITKQLLSPSNNARCKTLQKWIMVSAIGGG